MLIKSVKIFVILTVLLLSDIGAFRPIEKALEINDLKYIENEHNEVLIEYIAELIIPKIYFSRVLYDLNHTRNNLEENIIFVNGSSMPDEINGNVIIAGHNGNSNISYFKNLHKLELNDTFIIKYSNTEYHYKIVKKYFVDKTGTIEINKDIRYSTATLITCYGKKQQLVFIANLYKKNNL